MGREFKRRQTPTKLVQIRTLSKEEEPNKHKRLLCLCTTCGNEHRTSKGNFKHIKSCGCMKYHSHWRHGQWDGCGEISKTLFSTIKGDAESRALEWNVSIEFIWDLFLKQDRKCAISGVLLTLPNASRGMRTASLDRIDSKHGYVESNVQWVHSSINIMKWVLPQDEFIQWCRIIVEHNKDKKLNVEDDFLSREHARKYHLSSRSGRRGNI